MVLALYFRGIVVLARWRNIVFVTSILGPDLAAIFVYSLTPYIELISYHRGAWYSRVLLHSVIFHCTDISTQALATAAVIPCTAVIQGPLPSSCTNVFMTDRAHVVLSWSFPRKGGRAIVCLIPQPKLATSFAPTGLFPNLTMLPMEREKKTFKTITVTITEVGEQRLYMWLYTELTALQLH